MYYLYILQSSKDHGYYIGVSDDIDRRIQEHNNGYSKSTRPRRPLKLVYKEKFNNLSEAYKREKFIKSRKSKRIIELIINSGRVPK